MTSSSPGVFAATPKRPTFSSGTAIAPPGTIEIELGGAVSGDFFELPIDVRLTPALGGWLSRTELSFAFDGLDLREDRLRFSDRLVVSARSRIFESTRQLSFAIAPQVEFALRGDASAEFGLNLIGLREIGPHSIVGNLLVSAPMHEREEDPCQTWTWILGYSAALGAERRLSLFAEVQQERPQGQQAILSLLQGLSYQLRPNLILDFALQQDGVNGGNDPNVQVNAGVTWNLGRVVR